MRNFGGNMHTVFWDILLSCRHLNVLYFVILALHIKLRWTNKTIKVTYEKTNDNFRDNLHLTCFSFEN
jgi:hypothetical protein